MSVKNSSRLTLLVTFLVWTVFGFLKALGLWEYGVAIGLATSLCLVAILIIRKVTVKVMDWTMLSYFVVAGCATFMVYSTRFPAYSQVVVWLFYAAAAWGSMRLANLHASVCAGIGATRGLGESGFLAGEPADERGLGRDISGRSRTADCSPQPAAQFPLDCGRNTNIEYGCRLDFHRALHQDCPRPLPVKFQQPIARVGKRASARYVGPALEEPPPFDSLRRNRFDKPLARFHDLPFRPTLKRRTSSQWISVTHRSSRPSGRNCATGWRPICPKT